MKNTRKNVLTLYGLSQT